MNEDTGRRSAPSYEVLHTFLQGLQQKIDDVDKDLCAETDRLDLHDREISEAKWDINELWPMMRGMREEMSLLKHAVSDLIIVVDDVAKRAQVWH